jgi:hypothetical protein
MATSAAKEENGETVGFNLLKNCACVFIKIGIDKKTIKNMFK